VTGRPAVAFEDAVALTLGYLSDELPSHGWDIPTHKNVPNPRPPVFVRVLRTGGTSRAVVVDQAQLTVECWADHDADAADLASTVRALVSSMAGRVVDGVQCYRVAELSGPADLPDPLSDQNRMTWTVTVHLRGEELPSS